MFDYKTDSSQVLPFFVTIPHSGELVPEEATWLAGLTEPHLMRDVDRFVDKLYEGHLQKLAVPYLRADCHRYVIDLNRLPTDFDAQSVENAKNALGTHPKGLHWCLTTVGEPLILQPMSMKLHQTLVQKYYEPFHAQIKKHFAHFPQGPVYHLDAHSMPSQGTSAHNDPGETRADVVVSDFHGKSCSKKFTEIVIAAYEQQGFKVAYNWPYFGGGITQMYGKPEQNQHTLQVELNRKTYMDEHTKKIHDGFVSTQAKVGGALKSIASELRKLNP